MPSTGRSSSNHSNPSDPSTAPAREAKRCSSTSRCSAGTVSALIFTMLMTDILGIPWGISSSEVMTWCVKRGSQAKTRLRSTGREAGEAWLTRRSTAGRTDMPES
ncbi:hypothetical protein GCM10020254_57800 [Streptomyces goshikiensis]